MVPDFQFIDKRTALKAQAEALLKESLLAVDVEADSLHHYFPKVCLVQVSTNARTLLIDPLAVGGLNDLAPVFSSKSITKVFHGADYDVRSLSRDFSFRVRNLFDTMIAAQFVGEEEFGLAALLKTRFGVELNKKYQRANWSKRPLPREMLVYAAQDTAYLLSLYGQLMHELSLKGRLGWVEEECERLADECSSAGFKGRGGESGRTGDGDGNPDLLFLRFKGAGKLRRRDLAILENVLIYRERRAMEEDRPAFRIFGNSVVSELVQKKPTNPQALRSIDGLSHHFMTRYADGVLGAIRQGLDLPAHRLPAYPRSVPPPQDPGRKDRLCELKNWRDKKARELGMQPGLACNNALLEALARAKPQDMEGLDSLPEMRRWQKEAFGEEIIDTLKTATSSECDQPGKRTALSPRAWRPRRRHSRSQGDES